MKIKNSAKVFGYAESQSGLSFVLKNIKQFLCYVTVFVSI